MTVETIVPALTIAGRALTTLVAIGVGAYAARQTYRTVVDGVEAKLEKDRKDDEQSAYKEFMARQPHIVPAKKESSPRLG